MADSVDYGNVLNELFEKIALRRRKKVPKATGYCLYCETPLPSIGERFCDSDCLRDWEKEQEHKAREGS